ncbi:protein LTV1 [Salvia divinorum]|uniref:Protein LTV1 n=1 Tax=Salvia divinorum TaxID=28513 RepID=A0ABD1HD26_SALDI
MGKKKFFDEKKSATFPLMTRDASDPNYSSDPSGDRVFVRADNNEYLHTTMEDSVDPASIYVDARDNYDDEDPYGGSGEVLLIQVPAQPFIRLQIEPVSRY